MFFELQHYQENFNAEGFFSDAFHKCIAAHQSYPQLDAYEKALVIMPETVKNMFEIFSHAIKALDKDCSKIAQ